MFADQLTSWQTTYVLISKEEQMFLFKILKHFHAACHLVQQHVKTFFYKVCGVLSGDILFFLLKSTETN